MKLFTFSVLRKGLLAWLILILPPALPEEGKESRRPVDARQSATPLFSPDSTRQISFRVMSYNVENFFDTSPHPTHDDREFLPEGNRHWTPNRYYRKLQQIAKVITAAGEWETPALIGLCEIENDSVLIRLLNHTPLKQQDYRFCTARTSDRRGIRVALLYQRDKFRYLSHQSVPIRFSGNPHKHTRHILHAWGRVITGDTLDVCVCHFPSRYGGEKESEQDRMDAARTLRALCDSLTQNRRSPYLILMGDFNDTPENRSITEGLKAHPYRTPPPSPRLQLLRRISRPSPPANSLEDMQSTAFPSLSDTLPSLLYNLFVPFPSGALPGSHKYQGEWSQLDQMFVNAPLLSPTSPFRLRPESIRLFAPPFLLTKDKTWRGLRPFRTYYGFKYEGGFSDHLPILADFILCPPPPA